METTVKQDINVNTLKLENPQITPVFSMIIPKKTMSIGSVKCKAHNKKPFLPQSNEPIVNAVVIKDKQLITFVSVSLNALLDTTSTPI